MPVAQDHGAPGTDIVNIAVAVRIVYLAAVGTIDEKRIGAD